MEQNKELNNIEKLHKTIIKKTERIQTMERVIDAMAHRNVSLEAEIDRLNGIIYQKELDNGEV